MVLPCVGWGVTASQLDLPYMTLLSIAGCGRLQLVAPYWVPSVALLQVVNDLISILWSILHWEDPGHKRLPYFTSRFGINHETNNGLSIFNFKPSNEL